MRRFFVLLAAAACLWAVMAVPLLFTSCVPEVVPDNRMLVDHLFMVYMASSNDLESHGLDDFLEMEAAVQAIDADVLVLVLMDRMQSVGDSYGDWDDTRLYQIKKIEGQAVVTELDAPELGLTTLYIDEDLNMGHPETLKGFLRFAANRYNPSHAYLDLWSHGGGWFALPYSLPSRAIGLDSESEDMLNLIELREALAGGRMNFDVLLFDACDMALLETMAAIQNYTQTVVFSQRPVPGAGFDYTQLLPVLCSDSTLEEKCTAAVQTYTETYPSSNVSLSAFKIDKDNGFASILAAFNAALPLLDIQAIRAARSYCQEYSASAVDFSILITDPVRLASVVEAARIRHHPETLSGLSIYFPRWYDYCSLSAYYTTDYVRFLELSPYQDFIRSYNHSGVENRDTHEPNNTKNQAAPILVGQNLSSYIWCEDDIDWFVCTLDSPQSLCIQMEPPSSSDYDLAVFFTNAQGPQERKSTNNSGRETIELSAADLNNVQTLYIKIWPFHKAHNQTVPYRLTLE
jgi:hypothetical protein